MEQKLPLVFFLLFSWTYSQESPFVFKNITIDAGLSQNSVVDMAQDSIGFMWFATQDGLNRYDGQNFKIFPEVFDDITSPDHAQLGKVAVNGNKLWLITKGGKLKIMDLCTEDIFPVERLRPGMDLLPPVSSIYEDENEDVWIGTLKQGLYHWNSQNKLLNRFREDAEVPFAIAGNSVRSIFKDKDRKIWVLTSNGITRIEAKSSLTFLKGMNTNVVTQDKNGKIWVGTFGEGLYAKDPGADKFQQVQQYGADVFPENLVIEAILDDKKGNIWIGTYGNGLYLLDEKEEKILHFLPERRNPYSIGFQDILSIKEDKEGAIWIGTDGGGISYYNSHFHNFQRLIAQDVPDDISIQQIRAIATDEEGGIWLGTSGKGLTYISPDLREEKTFHLRPYQPGIANYDRIVSLLVDAEGDLWIGTQGNGLLIRDRKSGEIKKWFHSKARATENYVPDNTFWSLLETESGKVYAATRNAGVLLIDKNKGLLSSFSGSNTEYSNSDKTNIRSIVKVNDSLLALGAEGNALHLLNTCKGLFRTLQNPVIAETLKDEYGIKSLYYDKGFLWAGTAGQGLLVTHLASGSTTSITSEQGLPNEMIYGIIPEGKNSLWMSSNKGLLRLSYTFSGNNVRVKKIQSYTVGDGLQSNEFNTGAYHRSKNGTLYFGGINGLNFFHPKNVLQERKSGKVVLTGAMVDNEPLKTDSLITYQSHIKLPYSKNSISFNYTVLDFLSPETMSYEYMLEGYDEQWIQAGARKYTAYTNLPPGDYTFKVKPGEKMVANASPAVLGISISAPFWLEWWFFISAFLFLSGALYLFYRYRINQLLEVQRVKNSISADLHDDIGSRLTSIQFLSALSRKKLLIKEDTSGCLMGIEEEVQASAEALNEIVWNIKMDDESLEDIVAKMRRYAGEALENTGIIYSIDIAVDFTGKKMKMQKRREIFLIFKELLNNVRKHARAKKLTIEIGKEHDMFYLAVSDDGKGFDPLKKTGRNGLQNIRQRVEKWKGRLEIESQFNQGSTVRIWLPFDKFSILRRIFGRLKRN